VAQSFFGERFTAAASPFDRNKVIALAEGRQ
jgi:hypothetical protein